MPRVHHQGWMVTTHGDDVITVKLFKRERNPRKTCACSENSWTSEERDSADSKNSSEEKREHVQKKKGKQAHAKVTERSESLCFQRKWCRVCLSGSSGLPVLRVSAPRQKHLSISGQR